MSLPPEAPLLPQAALDHAVLLRDRSAILDYLPRRAVFVEVGVGIGVFTDLVLDRTDPALFVAIDDFKLDRHEVLWGTPTHELFKGLGHRGFYEDRFDEAIRQNRLRVNEADSVAGLAQLPDGFADVIYVDAGHFYHEVKADLEAALPKLRRDGRILVNDYLMVPGLNSDHAYGVVHAANEFMIEHGFGIEFFALHERMFCDVVIRRQAMLTPHRQAEIEALRHEIAVLRRSSSWRLTAPMRALGRRFRRA
jgi:hypothetical protein